MRQSVVASILSAAPPSLFRFLFFGGGSADYITQIHLNCICQSKLHFLPQIPRREKENVREGLGKSGTSSLTRQSDPDLTCSVLYGTCRSSRFVQRCLAWRLAAMLGCAIAQLSACGGAHSSPLEDMDISKRPTGLLSPDVRHLCLATLKSPFYVNVRPRAPRTTTPSHGLLRAAAPGMALAFRGGEVRTGIRYTRDDMYNMACACTCGILALVCMSVSRCDCEMRALTETCGARRDSGCWVERTIEYASLERGFNLRRIELGY